MLNKNLVTLLQRHPQLKTVLEKGNFLTGYSDGGVEGKTVNVFVFRCSWKHFCVQATAIDFLLPGEVLIVTNSSFKNVTHDWKAYSLKEEKHSLTKSNSFIHNSKNRSNLTSLAVQMAQQQHRHHSLSTRV